MLNKSYYIGYEGEGSVKIWSDENGKEIGMLIWNGFFETILQGCFNQSFQKEGLLECYYNHNGFYDYKWEMRYPHIVLDELINFNENLLETTNKEIIKKSKEIIESLISFINVSIRNKRNIFIEYD